MTENYLRRTVLGALGAIAAGTGIASATDDEKTYDDDVNRCRNAHGEFTECHKQEQEHEQQRTQEHRSSECDQCPDSQVGTIRIENNCPCTRMVFVSVSGSIADFPHPEDGGDSSASIHVAANDYTRYWFTGSITRLEMEPGDISVDIEQKSLDEANCEPADPMDKR